MPSFKDFFGGKTLSAEKLGKRIIQGKILDCEPITIKSKEGEENLRLCIKVVGEDKFIALNSTNAHALGAKWGDDYTKWIGHTVKIFSAPTTFAGKNVKGISIQPIK
jgi:hypothetical protein